MSATTTYVYKDLTTLVRVLKIGLIVTALLGLAGIWSSLMQIDLLHLAEASDGISEEMADASDLRQDVIHILSLASHAITTIAFFCWVYFSNRNAHALGARDMDYTPGWSVGWFFVPIANFWSPYKALNETFQASHPEYTEDWHHASAPWILPVWWALTILMVLIGRSSGIGTPESIPGMVDATWTKIYHDIVFIVLRIVTIVVVTTLFTWQTRKHAAVEEALEAEALAGEW